MRATARDLRLLRWVAEQYAVSIPQLARLMGRSEHAARWLRGRWQRAGWAQGRTVLVGRPVFVWLTRDGSRVAGAGFKVWEPNAGALAHIEAVNDVTPVEHELFVEGAASILTKPEYSDAHALRKTFLALQEKEKLVEILNTFLSEDGLQILVGSESDFTQVHNFSIVARRYGSSNAPLGMVGIIGPMRMEYARMAPLVDYLGRALSRKIEEQEHES